MSDDELTHFTLAFEGVGWKSDKLVAMCVLNTLMGGGSSFSAGGPGKGMYTRLYQNILNRYPQVQAASVFQSFFNGTGIFGVYGAAPADATGTLVAALCEELKKMATKIEAGELERAKNQLTSSLLMNLESRPILFEDIGRQVLVYGERTPPETLVKQIAAVTADDLTGVASKLLKTPPSVAVYGDTTAVPRYDLIAKQFA
jgi:processing peptidase subunit alpha